MVCVCVFVFVVYILYFPCPRVLENYNPGKVYDESMKVKAKRTVRVQ